MLTHKPVLFLTLEELLDERGVPWRLKWVEQQMPLRSSLPRWRASVGREYMMFLCPSHGFSASMQSQTGA